VSIRLSDRRRSGRPVSDDLFYAEPKSDGGTTTSRLTAPVIVSVSAAMQAVLTMASRAAASDAKVLITGESGVGKDLIARTIHSQSVRRSRPYVAVNCAGLTETLLESELFGHVKGSFTGAYRDKPGKLHLAHRGTLFLDEVGEMSVRMQSLLLRFLENGEIQAVGSDHAQVIVDVRIVAATNRNLHELVAAGRFREDLLYRLRVIQLHIPPLRERPEDIRPLVAHFVGQGSLRCAAFTEEAIRTLERHRWPGNVRELQNVVEQARWLSPTTLIDADHLPPPVKTAADAIMRSPERRRQVADELYQALVKGGYTFWEHVYPLFTARDITRHDVRELVRQGLSVSRGNYRALLKLFGMSSRQYKRFLNFLAAHDCRVDFREFREAAPEARRRPRVVLLPMLPRADMEEPLTNGPRPGDGPISRSGARS
jgi:DNA-binding NtrC family response regulator